MKGSNCFIVIFTQNDAYDMNKLVSLPDVHLFVYVDFFLLVLLESVFVVHHDTGINNDVALLPP